MSILRTRARRIAVLTLILLLAAAGRIIHIDMLSLWIDEGFTYYLTQYHDPLRMLYLDVHPPLYFVLVDGWVSLTGISVLAMRYFSVLPSMLSVALIYQVAHELQHMRRASGYVVPTLAALLMAIADPELFLAQEMRQYTLHVCFALLSMWGFLRWIRTDQRGWLLLWVIANALLVYTFYLGAFIGVVQGLYVLLFLNWRRRVTALGALVISALLVVPWLALTLPEQSGNLSYANWLHFNAGTLEDIVHRWFTRQWALTGGLALLGLITVTYGRKTRIRWQPLAPSALLVMWLIVPLALTFIINTEIPLYQPRRITQITPAIALMIAFGLGNLRGVAQTLLIAVLLVYGVTTVDYWRFKQPWADMAADTAPLFSPDDLLLVEVGGDDYAPVYHYSQALPDRVHVEGLTTWRHLSPETYEGGLPPLIDSQDHVWLFYWGKDQSALAWLNRLNFTRSAEITVDFNPDVYLWRYDRLPDEPLATYDNGMILHDAIISAPDLQIDLLWSADAPLDTDYVTSAALLDETGALVAQMDSVPFDGARPTTGWSDDELVYDPKLLVTPSGEPIPPGTYDVVVVVYAFAPDGTIVNQPTADDATTLTVGTLTVD